MPNVQSALMSRQVEYTYDSEYTKNIQNPMKIENCRIFFYLNNVES